MLGPVIIIALISEFCMHINIMKEVIYLHSSGSLKNQCTYTHAGIVSHILFPFSQQQVNDWVSASLYLYHCILHQPRAETKTIHLCTSLA